jgi:ADP-ribose pyrophosphatase
MDSQIEHWKRLSRKSLVDTKFLKVYEDTVELPNGTIFDDYTVAALPSGVVIVATDVEGKLLTQFEYKYAIDKIILNLPSGSVEDGDSVFVTAAKELLEETGYVSEELELIQETYEYPSKLSHSLYIVRAKNAKKVQDAVHEDSESISEVRLISADMQDYGGVFDTTYNITALALTLPEFLKKF